MNNDERLFDIVEIKNNNALSGEIDVFVTAAGFEERAIAFLKNSTFSGDAVCILALYENEVEGNEAIRASFMELAREKFQAKNIFCPKLSLGEIDKFKLEIHELVMALPHRATSVWIDISGFASYAICAVVEEFRSCRPYEPVNIIYSSAKEYYPSFEQFEKMEKEDGFEKSTLPPSMAMEMSKPLSFEPFTGRLSGESQSCLVLFAGYEPHRSAGIVEAINPSMLLLIYGSPLDESLQWREKLSRKIHGRFERTRRRAIETVGAQDIASTVELLEKYYDFLIDDYNMVISPICSKMQVLASYIFWERYQEIKLSFPLPIGYDPTFRPKGVGGTFHVQIPSRVRFK